MEEHFRCHKLVSKHQWQELAVICKLWRRKFLSVNIGKTFNRYNKFYKVISKHNRTRSINNYAIEENPAFPEFITMGQKTLKSKFRRTYGLLRHCDVCELVGLFTLNKLTSVVNKSHIELYRHDSLGIF